MEGNRPWTCLPERRKQTLLDSRHCCHFLETKYYVVGPGLSFFQFFPWKSQSFLKRKSTFATFKPALFLSSMDYSLSFELPLLNFFPGDTFPINYDGSICMETFLKQAGMGLEQSDTVCLLMGKFLSKLNTVLNSFLCSYEHWHDLTLAALDQQHEVQGWHPGPIKGSTNRVVVLRKVRTSTQTLT